MNKNLTNVLLVLLMIFPFMAQSQNTIEQSKTEADFDLQLVATDLNQSNNATDINYASDCPSQSLPYFEDFNNYTTDVSHSSMRPSTFPNHFLPSCWTFPTMTQSNNGGPAVWLTDYSSISIDNVSLRIVSSAQQSSYVVLPHMNAPLNLLKITFDYITKAGADDVRLGIMSDPNDFSTFVAIETFQASSTVAHASHSFANDHINPMHHYYIAIDAGNHNNGSIILDNISVNYVPSCNVPSNVIAHINSANDVEITWSASSTSYEVAYRERGYSQWINLVANGNSILLENLTASTNYEVRVRSLCDDGQTSGWSSIINFATPCGAYPLPFVENFHDITDAKQLECWSFYQGLANDVILGHTSLTTASTINWKYSSSTSLGIPHVYINIFGQGRKDWMVTPQIEIDNDAKLSFIYSLCSYDNPNVGIDGNVSDDRFIVLVTTDNGDTWTPIRTWGSTTNCDQSFSSIPLRAATVEIPLNQFIDQTIRIAFYVESTRSGDDNNLHIGNIRVDAVAPQCPRPYNLSANPHATSAVINWEGNGQSYDVTIRQRGSNSWASIVNVNSTSYNFTSLTPGTNYIYRVRQVCGEGLYSNWIQGSFTTLENYCDRPQISIGKAGSTSIKVSWEKMSEHHTWEVKIFSKIDTLYYDAYDYDYVAENLTPLTDYQVTVRAKCNENVYSDWSDTLSFTTQDCYPVSNIRISNITENSAMVRWTPEGEDHTWQIDYGDPGFYCGFGTFVTTTASSYAISGLQPHHVYEVYVRTKCSGRFQSIWGSSVRFQTKGEPVGIDDVDDNVILNIYPNPTSGATTVLLEGVDGKVTISVVDINGRMITNETMECDSNCEKRLDVSGLAKGTYFVRVLGDNINSIRKLIVR